MAIDSQEAVQKKAPHPRLHETVEGERGRAEEEEERSSVTKDGSMASPQWRHRADSVLRERMEGDHARIGRGEEGGRKTAIYLGGGANDEEG